MQLHTIHIVTMNRDSFRGGIILKRGRFFAVAATLLTAVALPLSTQETTGHAATRTPSSSMLRQSKTYYKYNARTLANRYGLNYASQTALTRQEVIKVYIASSNAQVQKSAKLAMSYWNQKLGHTVFAKGTKTNHTMTINMTTRSTSADAWWKPVQHQILLEQADYNQQLSLIRNKMINQSTSTTVTKTNNRILAYGHKIARQANFAHQYNSYRTAQINQAQKQINTQKHSIITQKIDVKARTFKYANIIAHEMGHAIGLQHSSNPKDAMSANSTTPNIYNYSKVKASKNGFNTLGKTDVNRAKLALAVHDALY